MHDAELIIRTKKEGRIYELLPVHALDGDFPRAFVKDYAHWLEIDTGSIEWRPLSGAWVSTSHNWQMRQGSQGQDALLQGSFKLIDFRSATAKAVSAMLSPLEKPAHIHITIDCGKRELGVHLPRLKLDFFLTKGASQLESKQFRGMAVDANQSFGALTGLVNKLVLRQIDSSSRSVLIPHGDVRFEPDGSHIRVNIDTPTQHVSYHLYSIDSRIGRLVDNGNLKSKLFKCYLHAVTAHCLIDELTGRTGTEEALAILASPSVRSFVSLDEMEIDLLMLIGRLTPTRRYYPSRLRVMQEVEWKNLPPLAQHVSFHLSVRAIFEQARESSFFHDMPTELPPLDICGDRRLLERAAIRDSSFRVHGFGIENHTTDLDVPYIARDSVSDTGRESQVYRIAKLVDDWPASLRGHSHLLQEIESWKRPLAGCRTADHFPLGFDTKWLEPPAEHLAADWCTLHNTLSSSVVDRDKYRIMVFLSTLTYSQLWEQELVQTLLAFATVPKLRAKSSPDFSLFQLSFGYSPNKEQLTDVIQNSCRPFRSCPEFDLPQGPHETSSEAVQRRKDGYETALAEQIGLFADALLDQWPSANVHNPEGHNFRTYISVDRATESSRQWFQTWYQNARFKQWVDGMQNILDDQDLVHANPNEYSFSEPTYCYRQRHGHVDLTDLMARPAPGLPSAPLENLRPWVGHKEKAKRKQGALELLLASISSESSSRYEQLYANDLRESVEALRNDDAECMLNGSTSALRSLLEEHFEQLKAHVEDVHWTICDHLQAETSAARQLAREAKTWPRLSVISLLQRLAGVSAVRLREDWRATLIAYGKAISSLQWIERLLKCLENSVELLSELSNAGHRDWDPMLHPDWLLLEIESDISIRRVQAQIAKEMISPTSGGNSVLQLNMGEGKSSVIVPIVAAALADGTKLVRVVVLKTLSAQMFRMLASKLGGMLGRRIFHMPISRSVRLDVGKAMRIRKLCEECMHSGGVLLVRPENLLSFEMMGLERLVLGETELGSVLVETQRWLDDNARDVLDESDEILNVRFELIYTMGTERAIEFSPDRWSLIEQVLGLVRYFAQQVQPLCPNGLNLRHVCRGSFPRIRMLHTFATNELLKMVAEDICYSGLPGLPVWRFPPHVRTVLYGILTDIDLSGAEIEPLQSHAFADDAMRSRLLLLRGLIAGGVLAFALQQKRWRVNYGLDLSRTMLAVPYRAKDIPATRAEFSHPDAAMVLTFLSYYYGGLSDEQLHIAFDQLLLSDHAQEEYESWVKDANELPDKFQQLAGINLKDTGQCSQIIFPSLRLAKGAIDFYVTRVVLPKEMKEFPEKLSSSGWDIARAKVHPTTGFSGTNDSKYILPLSMSQCDLPAQLHTNAGVLECLLRPENTFTHAMKDSGRESLDADSLLKAVIDAEPPVRVILDVGAQVLEWKNEQVAETWLSRVAASKAQAAVFFAHGDELSVLNRDGITESLITSPFAKQMDRCLVYLDEAHTRGTDLKLPTAYRAAVTLGPDLTKDRLVQGMVRPYQLHWPLANQNSVHAHAKARKRSIGHVLRAAGG